MADTATPSSESPSSTSRKRLWVVIAAVLVLVVVLIVGLLVFGARSATATAKSYDQDFAAWEAKDKQALLDATVRVPADTYVRKDINQPKGLAKQKKGCDALAASLKEVRAAGKSLPSLGGSAFKPLSSMYRDAADRSDKREKVVDAYGRAATATLQQLQTDCRWNIQYNSASTKSSAIYKKSSTYLMDPGDTEPGGVFCAAENKVSCVSSITKKKNAYADLRIKAAKTYRTKVSSLLSEDECGKTSYGSVCKVLEKTSSDYYKASLKGYGFVRTTATSTNNPRIRTELAKISKVLEKSSAPTRKAVFKEVPDLKTNKKVTKYPNWTDVFFPAVAKLRLAELKDERAAIDKL